MSGVLFAHDDIVAKSTGYGYSPQRERVNDRRPTVTDTPRLRCERLRNPIETRLPIPSREALRAGTDPSLRPNLGIPRRRSRSHCDIECPEEKFDSGILGSLASQFCDLGSLSFHSFPLAPPLALTTNGGWVCLCGLPDATRPSNVDT